MSAPQSFALWLTAHEHKDQVYGWVYHYHSRSDAHSIALCTRILEDLLQFSPPLTTAALADKIVYGINAKHTFPNGKRRRSTSQLAQLNKSSSRHASRTRFTQGRSNVCSYHARRRP